jgi:hypothetical protein
MPRGVLGAATAVGVAQLVERRSVAPNVAGSIPVSHPKFSPNPFVLKITGLQVLKTRAHNIPKNCGWLHLVVTQFDAHEFASLFKEHA